MSRSEWRGNREKGGRRPEGGGGARGGSPQAGRIVEMWREVPAPRTARAGGRGGSAWPPSLAERDARRARSWGVRCVARVVGADDSSPLTCRKNIEGMSSSAPRQFPDTSCLRVQGVPPTPGRAYTPGGTTGHPPPAPVGDAPA